MTALLDTTMHPKRSPLGRSATTPRRHARHDSPAPRAHGGQKQNDNNATPQVQDTDRRRRQKDVPTGGAHQSGTAPIRKKQSGANQDPGLWGFSRKSDIHVWIIYAFYLLICLF